MGRDYRKSLRFLRVILGLNSFCFRTVCGAPWTPENARWNINLEERHEPEHYRGAWTNHTYFPSPEDWRSLSIYQLLTDRFSDGDPRNNEAFAEGFDVRDMTFRHGGDFLGLTTKLPYIKGLGCRGIWISPIFQNGYNSYHQYSQLDFTLLDQRLGTKEDLRRLTTTAHALGLYVIVDVVMNHMSNEFFFEGHKDDGAHWRWHETKGLREYLLRPRKPVEELHRTPAGRQPYMDFWYNNTWDPEGQYPGTVYGQQGEARVDDGRGTYSSSDFHHNGDLQDFYDSFQIHYGKLYGTMDDLRLEHHRVQAKYIAMTNALISSCDVDGFRVDTPMQVPLTFFKAWVPAVKAHAKSLGKKSFGIFGEFYVTPARYATMTGRGKDLAMYGTNQYIDGPATMNGGIVYSYYWYMFTAFVYGKPQYADGFALAFEEESSMLDTFDEVSGQKRYAMWNFCNNHDNWRMQSMTSTQHFFVCLVIITFWPGIPLHYAGDEQNFRTPGSALDGWAREELSASLAWQAVRHQDNVLERDNFDMTSRNYLFIARLNALRRAYFGDFGNEECDELILPEAHLLDVIVFIRGCNKAKRVLVMANFNAKEARRAEMQSCWTQGQLLQDTVEQVDPWNVTVGVDGHVAVIVPAMSAYVFAPESRPLPPIVKKVYPPHGSVLRSKGRRANLRLYFDRAMHPSIADLVELDGHAGLFSCLDENCLQVGASVLAETLCRGLHTIRAPETLKDAEGRQMTSGFRSTFLVDPHDGIVAEPKIHARPGLICAHGQKLCHNAAGATWLRIRDASGNWTPWRPYESQSDWIAVAGVGVLVQYHAQGSSSYVVGDCLVRTLLRCHSTWHHHMKMRGEFNDWGEKPDVAMRPVDHFTWAANFTTDTFLKVKFVPGNGWEQSYGVHPTRKLLYGLPLFDPRSQSFEVEPYRSGAEASRRWMVERGFWSAHESMATSANFAADIWISPSCTPEPPPCPPPANGEEDWKCHGYREGENLDWCHWVGTIGCVTYALQNHSSEMSGCGECDCCHKQVTLIPKAETRTCCILFNDLLLNYTITPDLSLCRPSTVDVAPSWILQSGTIYEGLQARCEDGSGKEAVGQEREMLQEDQRDDSACASTENESISMTLIASIVSFALLLLLLYCHSCSRLYLSVVRQASADAKELSDTLVVRKDGVTSPNTTRHVVFASIEHCVPQRGINAFTGDTGTFLQDFIKEHPSGTLSLVHPMLGIDYGHLDLFSELTIVVDGKIQVVEVWTMEDEGREDLNLRWYFLRHEFFSDRTQESLFPQPMSKIRSLRFYSLWNQALAMLVDGLKPEIYHCLDCHQALSPLYMENPIPLVLLLRNPNASCAVESDVGDRFFKTVAQMRRMSLVFNLKIPTIRKFCLFEGRFNLLRAGVRYAEEAQHGRGLCVLSSAQKVLGENLRFLQAWRINALGHPSRLKVPKEQDIETLQKQRDLSRRALQHHAGLREDEDAKVFLFVGPWAQHAGVEQLAEVLPQILCRHEKAQVLLCGLCSDLFGVMAQDILCRVMSSFPGRLCFLSERFDLPEDLRRGVDFLLAPYLAEPIGQTDVELGLLGVPTVGCAAGALGRMPGIYFRQQNSNGSEMLKCGFFGVLECALKLPAAEYWQLAQAGTRATAIEAGFGVHWRKNLLKVYDEVQSLFVGRQSEDQEHFDDRLWSNAASQEELHSAMAPRRSSTLRPISSTADLAHQMQVLDIDDDAEFLAQPISASRAQEIMKAVAESLPYLTDHMDASDLQRDISQARQRLQERSHMTRGLMKPFARGLCLRIHLVMALCYMTSSVGELLLRTLQVESKVDEVSEEAPPFSELWLAFHVAMSIGSLMWLGLSYGIPPNLLMTASQGLSLLAFLLLPLLPDQLHEAHWSYLSFAAMSGVQSASKLLYILWNFNEDVERGFEVAIWRLAILEALRRSMAYLALLATYAGNLWVYKQVLFVISFTSLVLLFKAPYSYTAHVVPNTGLHRLGRSFWLLLLAEIFTSLGSYTQDVYGWLELNGWSVGEMQLQILLVIIALPLILHSTFGHLRRMQVWGPWALRDVACLLPSGLFLRSIALYDAGGHHRSGIFMAALLLSILIDTMRHVAILSALMTLLSSRWNALKGCYFALCCTSLATALSPWLSRYMDQWTDQLFENNGDAQLAMDEGVSQALCALPLAAMGYVFQATAAVFFNREVSTFKGHAWHGEGEKPQVSVRWLWVAQVRYRMRAAKIQLSTLQDRAQEEELALEQVQAVIEESFSLPSLLSPKGGGKHLWDSPKNQVLPVVEEPEEWEQPVADEQVPGEEILSNEQYLKVMFEDEDETSVKKSGMPPKDSLVSSSAVSFTVTELPVASVAEESQEDKDAATATSIPSFDITPLAQDAATFKSEFKEEEPCEEAESAEDLDEQENALDLEVEDEENEQDENDVSGGEENLRL